MSLTDLATHALRNGYTHCWCMPGVKVDMSVGPEWDVFSSQWEDENEVKYPMFSRVRYRGRKSQEVKIGFPEYGRWGWELDSPETLRTTVGYLEQVVQIPVEWSPGHMGTELVVHLNRTAKRQEWVRETTINLFDLPFKQTASKNGGDLYWKTEKLEQVQPGYYLHQFDKRSAYLSTCSGLYLGAGDPVHVDGEYNTTLPGIYRVTALPGRSCFDDANLPAIIATEWVTDDVLVYAIEQGYEAVIHEAWQWTEKHQTLRSYAEKLWNGRNAFRTGVDRFPHELARENAHSTMKEIALIATGKFGSTRTSHFQRPDWWAKVVGKTRVNTCRNLYKFYERGFTPVLLYSDSVYFVSSDPNPRTAIPGILDRENDLGGYRHEGTWRVTPKLIEKFQTDSPGKIQKWLEHYAQAMEVTCHG